MTLLVTPLAMAGAGLKYLLARKGPLAGNAIGDPRTYGLDAAACAAFIALLWPRLRSRDSVAIAVVGGVVATLLTPALPPGIPVVMAAAAALLAWRAPRPASRHGQGATP